MNRILPRYSYIPLVSMVILNMLAFYGTRLVNRSWPHFSMVLRIDGEIPLIPAAVLIYVLAYATWVIGYCVIARDSESLCYEILAGEHIAKILTLICFLAIPTIMERPEIPGDGLFSWGLRLIYSLDTPDNLFPSVHCLENWIIFRGSLRCKNVGTGYKAAMGIAALLVFASTLLVKQHVVLDVIGAVAIGELGLWIGKRLHAGNVFSRINTRLHMVQRH